LSHDAGLSAEADHHHVKQPGKNSGMSEIERFAHFRSRPPLTIRNLLQPNYERPVRQVAPCGDFVDARENHRSRCIEGCLVSQNFNAIEQVGELQEVNPVYAEAEAPIVRFYEDSFEWEHMSYFLYPYHWARRASWPMRAAAEAVDPQFQAFLQAGAARVIVPVTPGFEDKVGWFLDRSNPAVSELERILTPPPTSPPASADDAFRDLWIELLMDHKPDVARGSGTLTVENGAATVHINPDSEWRVNAQRDTGREIYIAGDQYEVVAVADETSFSMDRPYEGVSESNMPYAAGSTPFGPPWTVNVPTSLIVLAENVPALKAV
jgi:hypothetical protein